MPQAAGQILTLIRFELGRAFMRKQSLLYLSAFAFLWYFLIRYAVLNFAAMGGDSSSGLVWANAALSTYFKIALYVFCLLSMLACANQTCGDRVRGTLRFLTLRCSRLTIFSARFLSQWAVFALLILACSSALFIVITLNIGFEFEVFWQSALYSLVLIIGVLPFIALMAVLSVLIDSARKVSVAAVFIWALAASIIAGLSHYVPVLSVLEYLVPGFQFERLLALQGLDLLMLSYVPMIQAVVLLLAGAWLMKRQAL